MRLCQNKLPATSWRCVRVGQVQPVFGEAGLPVMTHRLFLNPNRSSDFGEIARLCHAACFSPSRRRSGLRRGVARSRMRTEAGKMPESLILSIGNGLGVSDDRFGLNGSGFLFADCAGCCSVRIVQGSCVKCKKLTISVILHRAVGVFCAAFVAAQAISYYRRFCCGCPAAGMDAVIAASVFCVSLRPVPSGASWLWKF